MWRPIRSIIDWWKKNQEEGSERFIEREELKEELNEISKDLKVILESPASKTPNYALERAVFIQNIFLQRKLTKATDGLKWATWVLAGATILFAWVTIKDSNHSVEILNTLKQIAEVVGYFLIIGLMILGGWKIIAWIIKSIWKSIWGKHIKK